MKIYPEILKVYFTDGSAAEKNFDLSRDIVFDDLAGLRITRDENGVFFPELYAMRDVSLKYVEIIFPLSDFSDETYYYNSALSTNDVTSVLKLSPETRDSMKDLILLKDKKSDENFSLGLVTAHRFYTVININADYVSVLYDMEDKTVRRDTTLALERFIFDNADENSFLERYSAIAARLNNARPLVDLPVGWCSWSCYYGDVNSDKIERAISQMAGIPGTDLVQIDDGWQKNGSFCGEWYYDETKFPQGLKPLADLTEKNGKIFGLWLSPLIITESSEHYESLKRMIKTDVVTLRPGNTNAHPFDFDNEEFYGHLKKTFQRMKYEYGAKYFKLDFLMSSVRKYVDDCTLVRFESDYRCALLRKTFTAIREAVGEETILLSCGAPMLECAGIFDAQRVSCDIIWGKDKNLPSYWQIMQDTTKTVLYRSFYNKSVFLNDPDGLVIRDFDRGDGFDCKYSEARLWATAVAFSGGSVLINEEFENLSPARKELFTRLIPPLGIAGKVVDMFEYPQPTRAYIKVDDNTAFLAIFNYTDKLVDMDFDLSGINMEGSFIFKCWEKQYAGYGCEIHEKNISPHGAVMYLLKKPCDRPGFVCSDINVFMGVNMFEEIWADERNLTVGIKDRYAEFLKPETKIYMYYPDRSAIPDGVRIIESVKDGVLAEKQL